MNIEGNCYEIENINKELVRLRKNVRELGNRKKELMNQVIDIMREKGESSFQYNGKTYIIEERQKHIRKPDKKKKQDTLLVLQDEGFHGTEAEEMYNKLTSAMRGPERVNYVLKK